jgi:squalene-hopene/tetraprenyl-beta-curcumene cyclase
MLRSVRVMAMAAAFAVPALSAMAADEHTDKARAAMTKAIAWPRVQQDKASGGWALPPAPAAGSTEAPKPVYPAITGLVVTGLLKDSSIKPTDPIVLDGVKFMLKYQQPDGGIYDKMLPSYNTSIVLSALAKIDTPEARAAIPKAQEFLRRQQWSEVAAKTDVSDSPQPIGTEHPYYGGIGYGRHGRPDLSNLSTMLQGLHDSGVAGDDAAFKRAIVFLQRVQMLDSVNDMPYADGSKQGGFIYSVVPNAESVEGRAGQGYAGTIEESLDDGTKVSRLRCYGSMTYAGFKSYIYAGMKKDDERVKAAYGWAQRNYTVQENPGMKNEGLYYYLVSMSRALNAWADGAAPTIATIKEDGSTATRNWADDVIDRLAGLQSEDGSFQAVDKRWMEDNAVLITAYAVIALGEAVEAKEAAVKK